MTAGQHGIRQLKKHGKKHKPVFRRTSKKLPSSHLVSDRPIGIEIRTGVRCKIETVAATWRTRALQPSVFVGMNLSFHHAGSTEKGLSRNEQYIFEVGKWERCECGG